MKEGRGGEGRGAKVSKRGAEGEKEDANTQVRTDIEISDEWKEKLLNGSVQPSKYPNFLTQLAAGKKNAPSIVAVRPPKKVPAEKPK